MCDDEMVSSVVIALVFCILFTAVARHERKRGRKYKALGFFGECGAIYIAWVLGLFIDVIASIFLVTIVAYMWNTIFFYRDENDKREGRRNKEENEVAPDEVSSKIGTGWKVLLIIVQFIVIVIMAVVIIGYDKKIEKANASEAKYLVLNELLKDCEKRNKEKSLSDDAFRGILMGLVDNPILVSFDVEDGKYAYLSDVKKKDLDKCANALYRYLVRNETVDYKDKGFTRRMLNMGVKEELLMLWSKNNGVFNELNRDEKFYELVFEEAYEISDRFDVDDPWLQINLKMFFKLFGFSEERSSLFVERIVIRKKNRLIKKDTP